MYYTDTLVGFILFLTVKFIVFRLGLNSFLGLFLFRQNSTPKIKQA